VAEGRYRTLVQECLPFSYLHAYDPLRLKSKKDLHIVPAIEVAVLTLVVFGVSIIFSL
jgi:hypothetical protein